MDFASLMSSEIAKSKTPSKSETEKDKKYISRREAEEARKAAYLAEQKRLEEERAAKAAAKRKREEEALEEARIREEKRRKLAEDIRRRKEAKEAEEERARRKRLGLPELPPTQEDGEGVKQEADEEEDLDGDEEGDISEEELRKKLRELKEPVTLFGESHAARLRRYRKLSRPGALTASGPIATTLPPVEEKDMKVPDKVPPASDKKARRFLFRQLASYFNMVLREWEAALAREDNADTFAGQAAHNAMISSKETMRPLFRKFEQGDLDESILEAIVEIVKAAQERRYVDANDGYLRLSIGKAAWPIGVTMVGIHERSAREKLHGGERGHIMGSEVTRKYLQSIKRCLTFAQVRWPPEDVRQLMG
jgi:pre-mRNA-splicing factor 18